MPRFVYRHSLLWTIGTGVLLVALFSDLVAHHSLSPGFVVALALLAAGLPHALLLLALRHQQHDVREATIAEVREMMADRVKNQLAVIHLCAPLTNEREVAPLAVSGIATSTSEIARLVDGLSPEMLGSWQAHYADASRGADAGLNKTRPAGMLQRAAASVSLGHLRKLTRSDRRSVLASGESSCTA